jgi:hypothetical protein
MRARKMPWVRMLLIDFAEDERFVLMPKPAKGILFDALVQEWVLDGLPNDLAAIAALTNSKLREVKASWQHVGPFFTGRTDGRLVFEPFQKEREHAAEVSAKRGDAAKSRWH